MKLIDKVVNTLFKAPELRDMRQSSERVVKGAEALIELNKRTITVLHEGENDATRA